MSGGVCVDCLTHHQTKFKVGEFNLLKTVGVENSVEIGMGILWVKSGDEM